MNKTTKNPRYNQVINLIRYHGHKNIDSIIMSESFYVEYLKERTKNIPILLLNDHLMATIGKTVAGCTILISEDVAGCIAARMPG